MTAPYENVLVHMYIADSAQPRKTSNVTRLFPVLWVGSGDETTPFLVCAHLLFSFFPVVSNHDLHWQANSPQ